MISHLNDLQKFLEMQKVREKIIVENSKLLAFFEYIEFTIRIEFDKNDKSRYKSKNREKEVKKQFRTAFSTCCREQKIQYYVRQVQNVQQILKQGNHPPIIQISGVLNSIGYSRSFNIKRWKDKALRLDKDKQIMFAQRQNKIKSYDMRNYLLRRSKNTEFKSFVLQAINDKPAQKSKTVHIGFPDDKLFNTWYATVKECMRITQWEFIYEMLFNSTSKYMPNLSQRVIANSSLSPEKSIIKKEQSKNSQEFKLKNVMSQSQVVQPQGDNNLEEKVKVNQPKANNSQNSSPISQEKIQEVKLQKKISHQKQKKQLQQQIKEYEKQQELKNVKKSFVYELVEGDNFQEPEIFEEMIEEEDQEIVKTKKHLDIFHKIYPEFQLEELQMLFNYETIYEQESFKLYRNMILEKKIKMIIQLDSNKFSKETLLTIISNPQILKHFNQNVQQINLKTFISSQNSAVLYQVNKAYNRLYRSRDFVFLRHVFCEGEKLYMIDKSFDNSSCPPFMTIVRGSFCIVWGIFERQDHIELVADVEITNQGILNVDQQINLTLKYLKNFAKIKNINTNEIKNYKLFDFEWDITKNEVNKIQDEMRSKRKTLVNLEKQDSLHQKAFLRKKQSQTESPKKVFYNSQNVTPQKDTNSQKIISLQEKKDYQLKKQKQKIAKKYQLSEKLMQKGQLNNQEVLQNQLQTQLSVMRKTDEKGLIIIDQNYTKHNFLLDPIKEKKNLFLKNSQEYHHVWKDQWAHDEKEGGMLFIHKKKLEDQKGVLKFVLSKIGKNLLSGQSITNISLPVDIFSPQSNLERFIFSMSYGPLVLENLEKQNLTEKLKKTVVFGLTNSILYLNMEKPFNPILGETFQCWIKGCPGYAQQISHHPPICALMFKGRGFNITAQIQSKVSLGLNSGTGTNDGIYRVKYQDGTEICFVTPGGQVSGLTVGERKFNIVGKSYYWVTNTNIMLEIVFDPFRKGFFSVGKSKEPSDFFQGTVYEVKPEFMAKFIAGKRKCPDEKERVRQFGKFNGYWNKYIEYNGQRIFELDKQLPFQLEYETFPLASDANWREDIEYRRLNKVTRAQTEKERLQVIQRKDRKLRQKYKKKK